MNKLLAANFMRLKKSKVFYAGLIFMAGFALLMQLSNYNMMKDGTEISLDANFFNAVPFAGIVTAAFSALFIGTEYSDGTIRNKVLVGHKRRDIYFSNLIVCIVAIFIMYAVHWIVYVAVGTPIFGWMHMETKAILLLILCVMLVVMAISSIFTLIVMLNQNKAVVSVVSVLLAFILLFTSSYILNRLNEPEYYGGYVMNESRQVVKVEPEKNERYISGTTRAVYEFFNDFLPGGQQLQIASYEVEKPWHLMGYSASIAVIMTAAGVLLFRKKDLR